MPAGFFKRNPDTRKYTGLQKQESIDVSVRILEILETNNEEKLCIIYNSQENVIMKKIKNEIN